MGLAAANIGLDGEETSNIQCFFDWWVVPGAIGLSFRCAAGDAMGDLVVEALKNIHHFGLNDPGFAAIKEDILDDGFVKHSGDAWGGIITDENARGFRLLQSAMAPSNRFLAHLVTSLQQQMAQPTYKESTKFQALSRMEILIAASWPAFMPFFYLDMPLPLPTTSPMADAS